MSDNIELGLWFTVQGLTTLDQVAEYITGLQRQSVSLQQENESLRRRIREYEATQTSPVPGKGHK